MLELINLKKKLLKSQGKEMEKVKGKEQVQEWWGKQKLPSRHKLKERKKERTPTTNPAKWNSIYIWSNHFSCKKERENLKTMITMELWIPLTRYFNPIVCVCVKRPPQLPPQYQQQRQLIQPNLLAFLL